LIGHEEDFYFHDDACGKFGCSPAWLYRYSNEDSFQNRGGKAIRTHEFHVIGDPRSGAHKGRPAYLGKHIQEVKDGKEGVQEGVQSKVLNTLFQRKKREELPETIRAFFRRVMAISPILANDGIWLAEKHGFRADDNNRSHATTPPKWTHKIFRAVFKEMGFHTEPQKGTKPPVWWWCPPGQDDAPSPTSAPKIERNYKQSDQWRRLAAGPVRSKSQNQQPDRAVPGTETSPAEATGTHGAGQQNGTLTSPTKRNVRKSSELVHGYYKICDAYYQKHVADRQGYPMAKAVHDATKKLPANYLGDGIEEQKSRLRKYAKRYKKPNENGGGQT
jgi:hypothetical protein